MLGLFRKILSRSSSTPPVPARVVVPQAPSAVASAPKSVSVPQAASRPVAQASAPIRVTVPVPMPAAAPALVPSAAAVPASGMQVQLALTEIVAGLPEALRHAVTAEAQQMISIPVEQLLPKLGQGTVTLTVGQLRACAPESFAALSGQDATPVALPLAQILSQLPPAHYARRHQKRTEVPEEIGAVFTPGGKGVSVSKPGAAQPAAVPAPPTVTVTVPVPAPVVAQVATPAPAQGARISMSPQSLATLGGKPAAPAPAPNKPINVPISQPAAPAVPLLPALPRQTSMSLPKPATNGNGNGASHSNGNGAAKSSGEELAVPLASVAPGWVQEVRAEFAGLDLDQTQVFIPLDLLEAAMKTGKVYFRWQDVATWMRPALAAAPAGKLGEAMLEFPLKVIAPLFMARHRGTAQTKASVDESIPDLFNGNGSLLTPPAGAPSGMDPMTAAARNITPVAPALAATRPVAPVAQAAPAPGISLEQIVGAAAKRFSAKEIVAHSARLPGVSGALLVMSDGLLVTSQTPPQVKADTIAAFIPQMFGRMNQYTKELSLGPLQHLTLGVDAGQWHFIKSDSVYLGVLGRHGEALPLNLLSQVAAELGSQSK